MTNPRGLMSIVSKLRTERTNLANHLKHVDAALTHLENLRGGNSYLKPGRTLSASARRKISLAQKARWAKWNAAQAKPQRIVSISVRRKIAAAQRARWAKLKKAA